jgi:hypothetical protein
MSPSLFWLAKSHVNYSPRLVSLSLTLVVVQALFAADR